MSKIELPPLPFAPDALDPVISKTTLEFHHGKHHNAYVTKAKGMVEGTKYASMSLEEVVVESAKDSAAPKGLFNNAAQIYNHNVYWLSLAPKSAGPSAELAAALTKDLGGLDKFKEDIVAKGVGHFASGWVWLTVKDKTLNLIDTHDADSAICHGHAPLLVLDVWEHAYYIDYKNERDRYLKTLANELINWDGASERYAAAMK